MRPHRSLLLILLAGCVALGSAPLSAQEGEGTGLLDKRKEGKYFLEVGAVVLRSDEFDYAPGWFDPDGEDGPAGFEKLDIPTDDAFTTDPRVVLGLNRPDGKTTIAFTLWEFNAEDGFDWFTDIRESTVKPTFSLQNIVFTRQGGINPLQNVRLRHERDLKYASAFYETNVFKETKHHRWRLLLGLEYWQFEDRMDLDYEYGAEYIQILNDFREFHDVQRIQSHTKSDRLGPAVGLESVFKLGKKFRLTTRAKIQWADESINVNYINRAGEQTPSITFTGNGFRFGGTSIDAPIGVHDRELLDLYGGLQGFGGLYLRLFGENEQKIVPTGEVSVRGAWDLNRWVQAGVEYRWLMLVDVPSAQLTAEAVRDTISSIDVDVVGLDTQEEPDDDKIVYNHATADLVVRHDVVLDGLNFFLRFNF